MALDKDTVQRIARLARIKVPETDLESLAGELDNILGWIEQLNEVDTDGVAPMTSVVEMDMAQREDAVTDGDIQGKVLGNAPDADRGYFTVPKVVE